jgi:hypothetical protein
MAAWLSFEQEQERQRVDRDRLGEDEEPESNREFQKTASVSHYRRLVVQRKMQPRRADGDRKQLGRSPGVGCHEKLGGSP